MSKKFKVGDLVNTTYDAAGIIIKITQDVEVGHLLYFVHLISGEEHWFTHDNLTKVA